MVSRPTFPERRFCAPAWLYQMSAGKTWNPGDYCQEVNEGKPVTWEVRDRVYYRQQGTISRGDTIVFFFCKTGKDGKAFKRPGIYGWGTVTRITHYTTASGIQKEDTITFEVNPPSDHLKKHVLWDQDIEQLVNDIRGGMFRGSVWDIDEDQPNEQAAYQDPRPHPSITGGVDSASVDQAYEPPCA